MAGNQQGNQPTVVLDDVVEFVADLICQRKFKSQIKRELADLFDAPVSPRSVETLMSKARQLLRERAGASQKDMKDNAVSLYEWVIRSDETSIREKLHAQAQLDEIFGLKSKFSDDGTPEETAERIRAALDEMKEKAHADADS